MQLSPQARKRAVDAFKHEITVALGVLHKALAEPAIAWRGQEHKLLLHRLKGGAGFLGYEHLTISIAQLEGGSLVYPKDPQEWLNELKFWEKEVAELT